jgi:hypothetical protein
MPFLDIGAIKSYVLGEKRANEWHTVAVCFSFALLRRKINGNWDNFHDA